MLALCGGPAQGLPLPPAPPPTHATPARLPAQAEQSLRGCSWLAVALQCVATLIRSAILEGGVQESAVAFYNVVRGARGG